LEGSLCWFGHFCYNLQIFQRTKLKDRAGMTQSESQRKRWRRIAFCAHKEFQKSITNLYFYLEI
ncbi:hypothetical protein, partial [Flavobacterium oreochromis]|uniref:hypothetical protein n=1 Tax=Flavobacterium oreochromis TaxID=2906078 RepID=UPI001F358626